MEEEQLGIRRDITQKYMLFSYSSFPTVILSHLYHNDDNHEIDFLS